MTSLVWFRGKDLRLSDHAPLRAALDAGSGVVLLFVLDPYFFAAERAQEFPHRAQFLLESLKALHDNIAHLGSRLFVVAGRSVEVVPEVARQVGAKRVLAQSWTEPFGRERDRRVGEALAGHDVAFELFDGETMAPPASLRTGQGEPFRVFTPFSRAFAREIRVAPPLPAPRALPGCDAELDTVPIPTLASLGIAHNPRLVVGGERAARQRLREFLDGPADAYHHDRDRMDRPGTSRLSADLKFGTLSARSVWSAVQSKATGTEWQRSYLNELVWREFSHALLWDRPSLLTEPFRPAWQKFPFLSPTDPVGQRRWQAWCDGRTGFPVVDASARQLLQEGFVHNRARMISASVLTKDLLIDYRRGEAHYLHWLVDGDWAQNNAGWQWATGCGCDAQPYFRIFNPTSQGERFDPDGDYVRRWVPELAALPARWIHAPHNAPSDVLSKAGVRIGTDYPAPIVDHAEARNLFLRVAKTALG